ncbi:lysine 2,3-aminomutase [Burkholderia sp. WAC0059]|uniref:KamA family radical SAM protein n=1 Tax=Burkholderia sp. WAC0059 TaxID=2066022 RepID=UPI000C7EABE7|nr:lysine 2,3-aminomutase [Burkholderia sp. WAC0059]PLZ01741.1 lysine 2,3-aminomutase [Burkholderia sp. WAC0059]
MDDEIKGRFRAYTRQTIHEASVWGRLSPEHREAIDIVGRVLPFRVNQYVLEELIDWDAVPDDPLFRLTFPVREMLRESEYVALRELVHGDAPREIIDREVGQIRMRMNPHPAGQQTHNVPWLDGVPLSGMQHKYRETVLFFPSAGQTCHAYCTFCFRWPQFVGMAGLKFDARESSHLVDYLKRHPEVTDVLITGGDPLVMNARLLGQILTPLLVPELAHVQNIRIGTKSVAYWPQRFVTDRDADDVMRLFESVVAAGRNLAIMGHYSHPNELESVIAQQAVRRIIGTGATLRMQAPLINHVNTDPGAWARLWTLGTRLGAIPYYMFVERDTGPADYFRLPLAEAYRIFCEAYRTVSGLARTVRGPSMSAFPGKVMIDGIVTVAGEKVFALQFLQARNAAWVRRPFYARFDPQATWFDELTPAFGEKAFFFQQEHQGDRLVIPVHAGDVVRAQGESLAEVSL